MIRTVKRWSAVAAVWLLAFALLGLAPTNANTPPRPDRVRVECRADEPTCEFRIDIPGLSGSGGIDVEVVRVGPLPTAAPSTIRVPGPVRTIIRTVRPPRQTIIRTAPPETIFRTRTAPPPPRRTVTAPPRTVTATPPRQTVTVGPPQVTATSRPRPTVTITAEPVIPQSTSDELAGSPEAPPSPSPSRQPPTDRDTLSPEAPEPDVVLPRIELSYPQVVAFSLVGLLILMGIILAALIAGYYLGWDDEKRKSRKFYDALRDELFKPRRR